MWPFIYIHWPKKPEEGKSGSLIIPGIFGSTGFFIMAVAVPFTFPGFRKFCLPYVPATDAQVRNVIRCLKNRKGNMIDLGSGDGRLVSIRIFMVKIVSYDFISQPKVFAAARMGIPSFGVELNPWLVGYSQITKYVKGLSNMANFKRKNLWDVDLSNYDNIVIFGVEEMMPSLLEKLNRELTLDKDYQVIACRFALPNITPSKIVGTGIDTVWVYEFPLNKKKYY